MNIEEQVLSIDQVRELQELGFDINKYASMCWAKLFDHNNFYRILNKEYAEYIELNDYIPTMTIGDIIEVLPTQIGEYELNINRRDVSYFDGRTNSPFYAYRYRFIDSLFDCLVWCIKEKHIEL